KMSIFGMVFCVLPGVTEVILAQDDSLWREAIEQGNKLREQAHYAEAEQAYLTALAEAEKFGPEDPRLASSQNNLASLYCLQARYAEAEKLCLNALALEEKILGPDHLELSSILNNLAEVYRVQSQFSKAEPLYRRSLAIREKSLAPRDP